MKGERPRKPRAQAASRKRNAKPQASTADTRSRVGAALPNDLDELIARAKARDVPSTGGRPSLYRPEWCNVVVALAHLGKGLNHLCKLLGVDRSTVSDWNNVHDDFAKACGLARAIRASVLEDALEGQARAHDVNWRLRVLANIAADDFRDRADVGVGGTPGAPPIPVVSLDGLDPIAAFHAVKDLTGPAWNAVRDQIDKKSERE